MQLFFAPNISEELSLPMDEARHCFNVLRKKEGDIINIVDGNGNWYECEIIDDNIKKNKLKVILKVDKSVDEQYIHLVVSPTKNMDRNEWMIEKAVEIGVSEISFILTSNSERRVLKLDRIEKKAISAMKQSLKAQKPIINEMIPYTDFINKNNIGEKLIAHLDENTVSLSSIKRDYKRCCLLIGPEGGFTEKEVQKAIESNYNSVSLGKSRLRTETAAIFSLSLLNQ